MGLPRRRPLPVAVALSALLAGAYLLWHPPTTDLAAQTFRAELWEREGFVVWTPAWYGGQPIPGYSLLYPPLGALLGPALTGALAAVAAAWLFARLALESAGERAWLGVVWFGAASAVPLYSGRITFALGLAIGLGALLAVRRRRSAPGALLGALAAAASPVAGLFLALGCGAVLLAGRVPLGGHAISRVYERAALATIAGTGAILAVLVLGFPSDGFHPFGFSAFVWVPVLLVALAAAAGRSEPVVLWGALLYAAAAVIAVAVETPLGGNVTRLAATFGGPLLAILLVRRSPLLLALLAIPLLYWQWETTVADVARAEREPATDATYFTPLLDRLGELAEGDPPPRVHVPPTQTRWEAVHVAERYPLARGWLRQSESADFALFRDGGLDPATYATWLYDRGISFVALAEGAELDYLAEDEARLLREQGDELPFLRELEVGGDWRLWEVRAADGSPIPADESLAGGGAELTELEADRYVVRVPGPGEYLLRVRHAPALEVVEGTGCIEPIGAANTRLSVPASAPGPQRIVVEAGLRPGMLFADERSCGP